VFWKSDQVLRFFFHRGVFIGEGTMSGVGPGALTPWRCGQAPGHASLACEALVAPPPTLRRISGSFRVK
jgi:hypothetical protein